jgi:ABC-type transport system involved in multi-copper enzyme maturation permease subunit
MSGNSDFTLVSESGWQRGLNNLLDNEFAGWWKTKMWWVQCLIWTSVIVFMLGGVIFSSKNFDFTEGIMLYSIFAGLFPAVGVVIIMQDALVGEKTTGTLAWVLSKPVARPAIILSKAAANSLGILVTMVLVPGVFAYALLSVASKAALNPIPFLEAWGIIFLSHLFYLTFTLMLGAFFNARGPVIGLALGLLFLQQYLVGLLPIFRYLLPWTLAIPLNNQNDAIVPALLSGAPMVTYLPILCVAVECVLFVLLALWRFNKDEF